MSEIYKLKLNKLLRHSKKRRTQIGMEDSVSWQKHGKISVGKLECQFLELVYLKRQF